MGGSGMNNMVIVAGSCYPKSSATGAIALKCADMFSQKYNVSVVCTQQGKYAMSGSSVNNIKFYTLTQWRHRMAYFAKEQAEIGSSFRKGFFRLLLFLLRGLGRIQSCFFTLDNMWWYKKAVYKQLLKINEKEKIDIVISLSAPHETHLAAMMFKKAFPSVKWVSYWLDMLASPVNKRNLFISIDKLSDIQNSIMENADLVYTSEEIYDNLNLRSEYVRTKIIAVPYMLKSDILDRNNYISFSTEDSIKLVYLGSFYEKFRNPEYMLRLISSLDSTNVSLHIYSQGECEELVATYANKYSNKIVKYSTVNNKDADYIMKNAHVLINIENDLDNSRPSKLYELISYRKPIINFYYQGHPTRAFCNYSLALDIEIGTPIEIAKKMICDFLTNCKTKNVPSKEEILLKYSKHTEDNIKKLFLNNI